MTGGRAAIVMTMVGIVGVTAGLLVGLGWIATAPRASTVNITIDTTKIRSGDLIFRRGRSPTSWVVRAGSMWQAFSHVGILEHDARGWAVVHADPGTPEHPGQVRREEVSAFLAPGAADSAAVYRVITANATQAMQVGTRALDDARRAMPFDSDLDLETSDRVYCTELVLRLYETVGVDVSRGARDTVALFGTHRILLTPNTLANSIALVAVDNATRVTREWPSGRSAETSAARPTAPARPRPARRFPY